MAERMNLAGPTWRAALGLWAVALGGCVEAPRPCDASPDTGLPLRQLGEPCAWDQHCRPDLRCVPWPAGSAADPGSSCTPPPDVGVPRACPPDVTHVWSSTPGRNGCVVHCVDGGCPAGSVCESFREFFYPCPVCNLCVPLAGPYDRCARECQAGLECHIPDSGPPGMCAVRCGCDADCPRSNRGVPRCLPTAGGGECVLACETDDDCFDHRSRCAPVDGTRAPFRICTPTYAL